MQRREWEYTGAKDVEYGAVREEEKTSEKVHGCSLGGHAAGDGGR